MANIRSIGGNPIVPDQISESFGGVMPKLLAGAAQALTGSDETLATWMQRTSEQDGVAEVKSIHGNTVVWNQYAYAYDSSSWVIAGNASFSTSGTALKLSTNGQSGNSCRVRNTSDVVPSGHKAYLAATIDNSHNTTNASCSLYKSNGNGTSVASLTGSIAAGTASARYTAIVTPSSDGWLALATSSSASTEDYVLFSDVMCIDLTLMFGAGNEPATVTEFEAMYPLPYYPYSAPTLKPVSITGIRSEDSDGNTLTERAIPVDTYFPTGLKSAGSVYDELTETQAVTRVGSVDLGTRTWNAYGSGQGYTYYANVVSSVPEKAGTTSNITCANYTVGASNTSLADGEMIGGSSDNRVYIRDDRYTDAAALKAALDGVCLYYELATPVTTPISPALNLTYKTELGGTEEVVLDSTATAPQSAPVPMVTVYGYTADGIVDKSLSVIAPVERGKASANYAVGAYLVMGHTLYKVTTAIASGESITPGTNVTATTVMAEVIALTQ